MPENGLSGSPERDVETDHGRAIETPSDERDGQRLGDEKKHASAEPLNKPIGLFRGGTLI